MSWPAEAVAKAWVADRAAKSEPSSFVRLEGRLARKDGPHKTRRRDLMLARAKV
jgi:hypothetical protein